MHGDSDQDEARLIAHLQTLGDPARSDLWTGLMDELQKMIETGIPLEDLGTEANRWFANEEDARAWVDRIIDALGKAHEDSAGAGTAQSVKDSNGTALLEGDSVTVIKDLKVKGGASDLKRGTLIKKIHLTGDPELIECRVGGSVLVLRTEFLKKS
jgi:protein PhnA